MTGRYQLCRKPVDLLVVLLEPVLGNVLRQVIFAELKEQIQVLLALLHPHQLHDVGVLQLHQSLVLLLHPLHEVLTVQLHQLDVVFLY